MSEIDFGKYRFIDYNHLRQEELFLILSERNKNNVRKWMNNDNIISWEEHIGFINTLKTTDEKKYWLVIRNETPIGSTYIVDINYTNRNGVWGFYLFESFQGTGWGVDVEFYALSIFFNYLKLKKVIGYVHKKNTTSLALQTIFNFKKAGDNNNQTIFRLTKDDYERLPKDLKQFKLKCIISNGSTQNNF